uniref:glutathione transferase n=1 Tax=Heliothis virescens TaxID=7102 RepID=A0A2A4IXL3_HELVI
MPRKLQYFDFNGLGEKIRYLLHYTGQEFEDVRHDITTWPIPEIKETLPFGQFPLYEEDGRVLCQSLAIAKYVARGTDLIPSDPWKQAQVDSAVYSIMDYNKHVVAAVHEPDPQKKIELRNKLFTEYIDYYFSRFEKLLKENGGYFSGKYFDFNGLGEKIRYLLHYTGQEFEDVRHDITTWPIPEIKETLPFGQFPLYEEDGRVLCQSLAIAKYVARGTDLIPSDPWKQAQVDSAVYSIMDYNKHVVAAVHEPDPQKKIELRNKLFTEYIDYYFSRFEKLLKENGGYFSGKLSWGEFVLCAAVDGTNFFFSTEIQKNYPAVKAVCEEIWNAPGVKEYIAARGPYSLDGIKKRFG